MAVSRQAKETAYRTCRAQSGPVVDGLHLRWIHGDPGGRDDVAKICHEVDAKGTLGALDESPMLPQGRQDSAEVARVVSPCLAINQNIIKEYKNKIAQVGPKNIIHERLECHRSISQPERHDQELVESAMGAEHRLVDVLWSHAQLLITRPQVELGEEARPMELIEELIDDEDGESVLDGERI